MTKGKGRRVTTNTSTSKGKKALIVILSLLAVGGVVGYILWKRKKDKDAEANTGGDTGGSTGDTGTGGSSTGGSTGSTGGGTGGSTSGSGSSYTFPFTSTTDGNAFRKWVNDTYPSYAKSINLDRTGGLNSYLQKAWDKYGSEYQKKGTATVTVTGTPLDQLEKNLGQGALPVERYTDHVTVRTTDGYSAYFYSSGFYSVGKGTSSKKGNWSDGGRKIVMANGRVISSGSVWSNIRTSITA
ncbi:MAG: hypothetical protein WCI04_00105 [archaeon]